jgi:hypothetical protein
MNDLLNHLPPQWVLAVALVLGVPAVLIALNELSFALARAGHALAPSVRFVRTWVIPLGALTLFLRWVDASAGTSLAVRLTATLCLATTIIAIMGIINSLVFVGLTWHLVEQGPQIAARPAACAAAVAIGLAMVYPLYGDVRSAAPSQLWA